MAKPVAIKYAHTDEEEALFIRESTYLGNPHYAYLGMSIRLSSERTSFTIHSKNSKDVPLKSITFYGFLEHLQTDIDKALADYYDSRLEKTGVELKRQDFIQIFRQLRIGDFFTKAILTVKTNVSYINPPLEFTIQRKHLSLNSNSRDKYIDLYKKLHDKGYISQQKLNMFLGVVGYSILEEFDVEEEKPKAKQNSYLS